MRTKLEITEDGSHTLFVPQLDEHYHSIHGAVQESNHVFIHTGLHHSKLDEINIFEVGFGTGLNTLLTFMDSQMSGVKINYTSIEAYPVEEDIWSQLNYAGENTIAKAVFRQIHEAVWGRNIVIADNFSLKKIEADFTQFDFDQLKGIDLIYFDAFGPDKQNDMWTQELFDNLYRVSNDEGLLVTYCAKGAVRRMMQSAGYVVERLPGPPGKREMLRATKKR